MPSNKRNMEVVTKELSKCLDCLNVIEQQLIDSDYLIGESISLADIVVGAVIYRLISQGLDIQLPKEVNRWYGIINQRTGYIKWIMSDFSELKGRESF
ncbi:glutathione S-transferase C-terminal domain-containing protein [Pseudoalteromonas sp. S558]|uniref:glutathione S-transferase C-terminal domain-containing protein n=1 Tax=Pseudoalteromonas sp. S558 TaxID=2066515 RepID=UPI00207BC2A0|nr:glutathione S-transferase C-terminal domain-containing protein [Pseudoalteromonas sp. S558]